MFISVLILAATVAPGPHRPAPTAPRPTPRATGLRLSTVAASDLYAARARRRLAGYLRMRLLELRKAGLERAASVVERKLPIERLFDRR